MQALRSLILDDLPTKADVQRLVYCVASIQEVQRISAVASISIPHLSTENISINGFFFPKGTTFIPNLRKCMRDATVFPNPMKVIPERHIDVDESTEIPTMRIKVS